MDVNVRNLVGRIANPSNLKGTGALLAAAVVVVAGLPNALNAQEGGSPPQIRMPGLEPGDLGQETGTQSGLPPRLVSSQDVPPAPDGGLTEPGHLAPEPMTPQPNDLPLYEQDLETLMRTPAHVFEHPDANPGFSPLYHYEGEFPEPEPELTWRIWEEWMGLLERPHEPLVRVSEFLLQAEHDGYGFTESSALSGYPIGIQPIQDRPPLIVEYPETFLGPGVIQPGIELPTGGVWRPTLWIFGQNRFGVTYREDQGGANFGSVVNRLNLFGQLNLSGTEHVVMQLRPFDEEEGRPLLTGREYSSYFWNNNAVPAGRQVDHLDGFNDDINTLYFEGQFDEIFANIDPFDHKFLDFGFSVGRQPMSFQRGLMMNEDMIDAVTITRNTVYGGPVLNSRMTFIYAWNRLTRIAPLNPNTDAELYAFITETDFKFNTLYVDFGFVDDPNPAHGDLAVFGISSTQRWVGYHNTYNSRFHLLVSWPTEGERTRTAFMGSPGNVSGQGELFFSQISMTPHETEDLIYWNFFWAVDQFTSLARAPQAGPLGDTGLLFAAAGLGLYGPPLATVANSSVGTALGYQIFLDTKEQQIIYEVGAREGKGADDLEIAGAVQYQRAFGQNWIWLVTGFLSGRHNTDGLSQGLRTEIQFFF